tara:strand:+ start:755 stop:1009 length:255 start_codon:yes stop_codon:yes gene_type:complete
MKILEKAMVFDCLTVSPLIRFSVQEILPMEKLCFCRVKKCSCLAVIVWNLCLIVIGLALKICGALIVEGLAALHRFYTFGLDFN